MTQEIFKRARALSIALALSALAYVPEAGAQKVDRVVGEQAAADKEAVASQAKIDQLSDQTQDMLGKYRQALTDAESLKKYNEQLAIQVKSQTDRIAQMKKQLVDIEGTQRDVLPLMQKMIETLEQFVPLDVPFLIEERTKRVANLKQMMARADNRARATHDPGAVLAKAALSAAKRLGLGNRQLGQILGSSEAGTLTRWSGCVW